MSHQIEGCINCVFYRESRPHKFENGHGKDEHGRTFDPTHISCLKSGFLEVRTKCKVFKPILTAA